MAAQTPPAKHVRSPSYPGIDLEDAINRARTLYGVANRQNVGVNVALGAWGYKPGSGLGGVVLAALKKFGLLDDSGKGVSRQVRLTPRALAIIQDDRPESPDRDRLIKEAALAPKIYQELWDAYDGQVPGDPAIAFRLKNEKAFTDQGATEFIAAFRKTIDFARLSASDKLSDGRDDKDQSQKGQPLGTGAETPLKQIDTGKGGQTRTVPIPLVDSEWATLQIPVPITEADWAQMLSVLEAIKPGMVRKPPEPPKPAKNSDGAPE